MNKTALIFGAGKTGRGFAAHLAFLGGYDIVLIDKNRQLVNDLNKSGHYEIQILGNEKLSSTIKTSGVYQVDDVSWHNKFITTVLVFTSVFGNKLEELAKSIALALKKRFEENPEQILNIITCENLTDSADILKKAVLKNIGEEKGKWLSEYVGFSESMILRTCLEAGPDQSPLTIRAQNFFELPCDGETLKEVPDVYGLKPLKNFGNQLRRKIYTYNCINAVITYLGAKKGFTQLHEAGNDEEILKIAGKASKETSLAQISEFGFDNKEQEEWVDAALRKFADKSIPDPIERNGADPSRKLGRDDRLIGPALLALKHGIYPEGLLEGIIACFEYRDKSKNIRISDIIIEKGADFVLKSICELSEEEELYKIIKERIIKSVLNE
jgi:mannitol-1-phosphate 5-dehydrogenase